MSSYDNPSATLQQAINEDSNLEMDWLWFAEQVSDKAEARYCLNRALYINPNSRAAHAQLRALEQPITSKHGFPLHFAALLPARLHLNRAHS
jgi:hypothetical protein